MGGRCTPSVFSSQRKTKWLGGVVTGMFSGSGGWSGTPAQPHSTNRSTLSGCLSAYAQAMYPPSECPSSTIFSAPSLTRRSSMPSTKNRSMSSTEGFGSAAAASAAAAAAGVVSAPLLSRRLPLSPSSGAMEDDADVGVKTSAQSGLV